MSVDSFIRKTHRVLAGLFLLTLPTAAYYSFTGDKAHPSVFVYLPLLPLFILILTGTYQLVAPWIRKARARRTTKPTDS